MEKGIAEIEIKVIGWSEEALLPRIKVLGGFFDREELQVNYHIDSSGRPVDPSAYLRLRVTSVAGEEQKRELTYKERAASSSARVNTEYTTPVADVASMLSVLAKLGYDRVSRGVKRRRRYVLGDCSLEFDEWDKATLSYPYLEIEAPSEKHLFQLIGDLGIPETCVTTKSIAQLRAEDGKCANP